LRSGAILVTRAEEVVEVVGHAGELAGEQYRPTSALDGLEDNELRVYDALPARGARTVDEIAVASGLPPTQVLGPLSMLEIAGLVISQGGRWKLALR
jgi:DNA processing protein